MVVSSRCCECDKDCAKFDDFQYRTCAGCGRCKLTFYNFLQLNIFATCLSGDLHCFIAGKRRREIREK